MPDAAAETPQGSAFLALIGGQMEEMSEGYMRISLVLGPQHTNPNGVMHGGVVTALMDEAIGGAIAGQRGMEVMREAPHATVEMNASFMAAARPGDRIVVEGRVLRLGRSMAFGEAEASRDGELIAKGRMAFAIISRRA